MNSLITLLIPTHNRHTYLERILNYYANASFPVCIADSTPDSYKKMPLPDRFSYYHVPDLTLPQKIELLLQDVQTKYVVLCADDDFIVPDGINTCLQFLESHVDYASAQGYCLIYKKKRNNADEVAFSPLYKNFIGYIIQETDALARLRTLSTCYRSLFYAVHRTSVLRECYRGVGTIIKNLYINEYNTSFISILSGKYAELSSFYQVREYSDSSDDKMTENLDVLFQDAKYKAEIDAYLDFTSQKLSRITDIESKITRSLLLEAFTTLAATLTKVPPLTFKKKAGKLISYVPVIGKKVIEKSRKKERITDLQKVIRSKKDVDNLALIKNCINKYSLSV